MVNAELIALTESTDLIVPLGCSVLRLVCANIARWQAEGNIQIPPVANNLSGAELADLTLPNRIIDTIDEFRVLPGRLIFELSEQTVATEGIRALKTIHGLNRLGVGLAIDGLWTGYAHSTP
jgi:EAL domain-containing protein (putative c-di-GMP-specific phosphodiesterase class I)